MMGAVCILMVFMSVLFFLKVKPMFIRVIQKVLARAFH